MVHVHCIIFYNMEVSYFSPLSHPGAPEVSYFKQATHCWAFKIFHFFPIADNTVTSISVYVTAHLSSDPQDFFPKGFER